MLKNNMPLTRNYSSIFAATYVYGLLPQELEDFCHHSLNDPYDR